MTRRTPGAVVRTGLMAAGAWLLGRPSLPQVALPVGEERLGAQENGDLAILTSRSIIQQSDSGPLIELLRIKFGMPREVFEATVRPVIEGYAEYVQLLPAASSSRVTPGLLLVDSLARVLRALDYRRGLILPRGAPAEVIGAQTHRWTYAVAVGALLCDIDEAMSEVAVTMWRRDGAQMRWSPYAGPMQGSGALRYRVERLEKAAFAAEFPGRLALLLLDRIVPPSAFAWLTAAHEPMGELRGFLAGDEAAGSGAIGSIVTRAHTRLKGTSMSTAVRSASGPATQTPTRGSRVECENVGQGGGEAVAASPTTQPDGGQASGAGGPLDSRGNEAACGASTPVITAAPRASALPTADSEFLEDFGAQYGSSHSLLTQDGITGEAVVPGSGSDLSSTLPGALRAKGPSPEADRFMDWLRAGLADGRLPFNEPGALVHFVAEGMLLVSPRIFREYAMRCGENAQPCEVTGGERKADVGKSIQLQVLRAGWHIHGRKGTNLLSYQVTRGDRPASRLSGIVIRDPERFLTPVPPVNPLLIRLPPDSRAA